MSDTEGTAGTDTEEILEFKCRKCPGKTFTAAEKDSHRLFHKQEKEKEKKRKPGPKSKTRSGTRAREPSPAASELTLFQPINESQGKSKPAEKRGRTRGRTTADDEPPAKRKSKKIYDDSAIGKWANGTGA